MRKYCSVLLLIGLFHPAFSQKKPLDHSVYDGWENVGERVLSPDGKFLVYTILPQEGDGRLIIRSTETDYAKEIPRGANAEISADSRFVVFHIRPYFHALRDARIKKKTPDQSPKDTLAWVELGRDSVGKIPRVRSFKMPEKAGGWLAYLMEKPLPAAPGAATPPDSLTRMRQLLTKADSLSHVADSLRAKVAEAASKGLTVLSKPSAAKKESSGAGETVEEGTPLILKNLATGEERKFPLTSEYEFSTNGKTLIVETTRKNGDSLSKGLVLWVHTAEGRIDTAMKGFNDATGYALDEAGSQLAFVAERDSASKALVKFYRLWYYTPGMDSAIVKADRNNLAKGLTVSPDYATHFSKDGSRLFLGLAPIRLPKDTSLVDFETARLDIWNYQDDYLPPQQLVQLNKELKRSYLAMIPKESGKLIPLADEHCETVQLTPEGKGDHALGSTTKPWRIQQQWEGSNDQDLFLIDLHDGSRKLIKEKVRDGGTLSPGGKFIIWYDFHLKHWFTYAIASGKTTNISRGITTPLWDVEDDHPDDPPPYGLMGWQQDDKYVYVYDQYDIYQCDPLGAVAPLNLTKGLGRARRTSIRYVGLDREQEYLRDGQTVLLTLFDHRDMSNGLKLYRLGTPFALSGRAPTFPCTYNGFVKAKNAWRLAYLKGSFDKPYDLYVSAPIDTNALTMQAPVAQYSHIDPQQEKYNWFTVELHHWKMPDGRMNEGLLYKPENFDSTKKYPIIFYYYERDAETRYNYIAPQPSRSIINIPYFVSNGYLVFDPDIWYKKGQPGEDAYNSVMSAVKYLSRFKWVDTTKMGLEGHSWGGYQTAYLVTRTPIFAAAEAGAPVANMTSAYGGIRWSTGISRQFQYERSQSRLGASLWQQPELYIKNSPLFRADKVTTPLLIMHNDADGAVPWYQGIELFSALRRLGKKVWLMEYNGEDHGLIERRNRKDWSQRLSQFFDYYLKGGPAPQWLSHGVPATLKGIEWGLGTE